MHEAPLDASADSANATDPTNEASAATPTPAGSRIGALAAYIQSAQPGERAALARLTPGELRPHEVAALSRALVSAGLSPDTWRVNTWAQWALIAHGMALAGHDGKGRLGRQLAQASVAESRVTKLLTARGDAFRQGLPRLLRLMTSKGVSPNWFELSELVLREAEPAAEDRRLRIAGDYFVSLAQSK